MSDALSGVLLDSIQLAGRAVHRIGLGTNRVTNTPAIRSFLHRAMELRIDFFDTADVYTSGESEATLGAVLPRDPPAPLVATKGGLIRTAQGYEADGRPAHLEAAVEGSLRRLGSEQLELYFLHRVDPRVTLEESLSALKELQLAGRIRHIGISNVSLAELERARRVVRIVCVQNRYNLTEREHEDVLHYCEDHEIVFIPYMPFRRGKVEPVGVLSEIADHHGVSPYQVALAWLLRRSPVMLPIPGTLSEEHLTQNLGAATLKLDTEERRTLDECAGTRA